MTKGCIEYYFLLHYEKTQPLIVTVQDKENLLKRLSTKDYCPGYKKGDKETIWKIAERYTMAIENGEWCLKRIADELKGVSTEDAITEKFYYTDSTFTNTHRAVQYLCDLKWQ